MPSSRNPLRTLVREAIPDGLVWLDSVDLTHIEAARAMELPFIFEIGRITGVGGTHTVHEAELVAAALPEDQRDVAGLTAALKDYARFVVATNPTRHARLSGRVRDAHTEAGRRNAGEHR